ncbi:hypothetical protein FQZ97_887580 [compost metagenome]
MRLAAGALEVHHQLPRHLHGDVAATVFLHQRQRQVDAGAHPRRGPYRALLDEDRVGVDLDRREALLERVAHGPVGRRAAALEQAGLGQQKGAAADRGDTPGAVQVAPQPGHELAVAVEGLADRRGAGDDEGVDRQLGELLQAQGIHRQALGRLDQTALQAGGLQVVAGQAAFLHAFGRDPEHRLGAGEVEQAHLLIGDEHQLARLALGAEGGIGVRCFHRSCRARPACREPGGAAWSPVVNRSAEIGFVPWLVKQAGLGNRPFARSRTRSKSLRTTGPVNDCLSVCTRGWGHYPGGAPSILAVRLR